MTFAVTNAGKLPHEFTLGDCATQLDHERQMQLADLAGGHAHHHGAASATLTVPPGETRHLTWTFDEPDLVLYGCHVLGHWAAGMRGTIVVIAPDRPPLSWAAHLSPDELGTRRTATPGRSLTPPRTSRS